MRVQQGRLRRSVRRIATKLANRVTHALSANGLMLRALRRMAQALDRHVRRAAEARIEIRRTGQRSDERTLRRVAEAQQGGLSSQESAARYARGDNPGGIHHRAAPHLREGQLYEGPDGEEPPARAERAPGRPKRMASTRRG
jgi:hypothetical protein